MIRKLSCVACLVLCVSLLTSPLTIVTRAQGQDQTITTTTITEDNQMVTPVLPDTTTSETTVSNENSNPIENPTPNIPDAGADAPGLFADPGSFGGFSLFSLAGSGNGWELENFTKHVVIKDTALFAPNDIVWDNLNPGASPALNSTSDYSLTLQFEENIVGDQFAYNSEGWLTYQLPAGITPAAAINTQSIFSFTNAGVVIGEFSLDAVGLLKVKFYNLQNDGTQTTSGENFIDFYSNATFSVAAAVKAQSVGGGTREIDFGSGLTVNVTVTASTNASVTVTKTSDSFNTTTLSANYTIKISVPSSSAAVSNISLVDDNYLHVKHLQDDTGTTPYIELVGSYSVAISGGGISSVNPSNTAMVVSASRVGANATQVKRFTVPLNITLQPGQTATVTYKLKLNSDMFLPSGPNYPAYLAGLQLADDGAPSGLNSAVVVNGEAPDATAVTNSAVHRLSVILTTVHKAGSLQPNNSVLWSVTIGKADLEWDYRGVTIQDEPGHVNMNWTSGSILQITLKNNSSVLATYNVPAGTNQDGVTWGTGPPKSFSFTVPNTAQAVTGVLMTCYTGPNTGTGPTESNRVALWKNSTEWGHYTAYVSVVSSSDTPSIGIYPNLLDANGETFVEYTVFVKVPGSLYGQKLNIDNTLDVKFENDGIWYEVNNLGQDAAVNLFNLNAAGKWGTDLDMLHKETSLSSYSITFGANMWWFRPFSGANTRTLSFPHGSDISEWNGSSANSLLVLTWREPLSAPMLSGAYATLGDALHANNRPRLRLQTTARYADTSVSNTNYFIPEPMHSSLYNEQTGVIDCTAAFYYGAENTSLTAKEPLITCYYSPTLKLKGNDTAQAATLPSNPSNVTDFYRFSANSPGLAYFTAKSGFGDDYYIPVVNASNKPIAVQSDGSFSIDISQITKIYTKSSASSTWSGPSVSADWYNNNIAPIVLHYRLESSGAPGSGAISPITLTNSSAITYKKGFFDGAARSYHSGTLRPSSTVSYGGAVKKGMAVSGSRAGFSISINPTGASFSNGANTVITVVDEMNTNLAPYLSSLCVYATEGGAVVDKTSQLAPGTLNAEVPYTYVYDNADNKIVFYLPDGVPLRIVYDCQILGAEGAAVDVENAVTINGVYTTAESQNILISQAAAGGGGSRTDLVILKTDVSDPTAHLAGALFALYGPSDGSVSPPGGSSIQPTIVSNGGTFHYYDSAVTDTNGLARFTHPNIVANSGLLFALVEMEAPVNYIVLAEPILFSMGASDQSLLPSGFEVAALTGLPAITDNMTITNERLIVALPSTGGIGATIFIVTGLCILMVSGFFILKKYTRKKAV